MKVCIVGAGFAGLSVAYHLTKYNNSKENKLFDIHILEARNRIGGRVYPYELTKATDEDNNGQPSKKVIVDMGGQWIHESSQKNPIVSLCKELDIPLLYAKKKQLKKKQQQQQSSPSKSKNKKKKPKQDKSQSQPLRIESGTYMADGTRIPDPIFKKASRFYYKAIGEYNARRITSQTSFQDLLDDAINDYEKQQQQQRSQQKEQKLSTEDSQNQNQQNHELFIQILKFLGHRTECYEGGRLSELSVELSDQYKNLGGPDEIPDGGYNAVLKKLSDCLLSQTTKMHFHCEVKSIQYNNNKDDTSKKNDDSCGVRIRYCATRNQTKTTENTIGQGDDDDDGNNQQYQQKDDHDDDSVEEKLLEADCCVCTVPLGVLKRKVIKFDPPLSEQHRKAIDSIGMGVLNKIMMLFDRQFWPSTGDDFNIGIISENPTKIQKFIDCSEDYGGQPVLAMLLGGNVTRRFDNENENTEGLLSDDQIIDEAMTTLRTLFDKHGGATTIPSKPTSYKISRWLQDPYAYGSYSYTKIGSTSKDYDFIIGDSAGSNLFFAGEHTSKHHHSTVHGAWMTGQREANRIIQIVQQKQKSTTKR